MSENPYQSPLSSPDSSKPAVGVLSGQRADLRSIAVYQKVILVTILIYLLGVISQFILPPAAIMIVSLCVLVAVIVGAVFVIMMAIKVYGVGLGVVFGILSLVPCLGLIMLLVINAKATSILKMNGIKVGLMGANVSEI